MQIHQELQAAWEALPVLDLSNLAEVRIQKAREVPEFTPIVGVTRSHVDIPAQSPSRLIGLDLYTPAGKGEMPAVLWIHGGGLHCGIRRGRRRLVRGIGPCVGGRGCRGGIPAGSGASLSGRVGGLLSGVGLDDGECG